MHCKIKPFTNWWPNCSALSVLIPDLQGVQHVANWLAVTWRARFLGASKSRMGYFDMITFLQVSVVSWKSDVCSASAAVVLYAILCDIVPRYNSTRPVRLFQGLAFAPHNRLLSNISGLYDYIMGRSYQYRFDQLINDNEIIIKPKAVYNIFYIPTRLTVTSMD